MAKYSVLQHPVETLLSWIKSGEIAIPEIQRPFVWKATKVRDLIDSLYKGYPVGYIITWQNPTVKLKDGSVSRNKKVLIDGQQRITALTAAIVGLRVLNDNYKEINIKIAFNPIDEEFDVLNKVHENDSKWINSINPIINDEITISRAIREYLKANEDNPAVTEELIEERLENLKRIKNKMVGIIELDHSLDINTVTEIFIRINQKGVVLSNADFVMSKIAADEEHGGNRMRKMIDYFCRLIVDKDFNKHIVDNDKIFSEHAYYNAIKWMAREQDNLYKPDYVDMLRVAFTYKFQRGKFSDLVALLSGRNFITRDFEEEIATKSFSDLEEGLLAFVSQTNYQRFIMIVQSAGFIDSKLIASRNSLNFAYALYLHLRFLRMPETEIQKYIKRWLVFSLLTARYSGSVESVLDDDIKQINEKGIAAYLSLMEQTHLSDGYWKYGLVDNLESSSTNNNSFNVYLSAQCYFNTTAFLSKSMTINSLITQRGDIHHLYPKQYLTKFGKAPKEYNQVANFVFTEQATNIKIGAKAPVDYMKLVFDQINAGKNDFSSIDDQSSLLENFRLNDIPLLLNDGEHHNYEEFLRRRKELIATKIKMYYESL
ncbi:DUF262 domain-containing protein [Flavobacterium sp. NRK1]|uniref:GmrSD restriction endonuclease domain-containing protein n=1 Tax=Flavobacterium sp. NRK1 TaxID=2954929 RepID=UPI00209343DD|nr:DUF262 domain-containing protein [Flavobacterium sp. NRK1]MCO6148949.1 DUF262 domain-containing protein [Flavobacterium sp. NRK1]